VSNESQKGQTGGVPLNAISAAPLLRPNEASHHAQRFIGQQVREHYRAAGKQIEWEHPIYGFAWDMLSQPEEKPKTLFTLFGEECVEAIRETKNGVPVKENASFNFLQQQLFDTFGTILPTEWFEKWLVEQEWDELRLNDFQ